jgi:hypothetical protein
MVSSLYPDLQSRLSDLAQRGSKLNSEPRDKIQVIWEEVNGKDAGQSSNPARHVEMVRSIMELLGRDLVVAPIVSGEV